MRETKSENKIVKADFSKTIKQRDLELDNMYEYCKTLTRANAELRAELRVERSLTLWDRIKLKCQEVFRV